MIVSLEEIVGLSPNSSESKLADALVEADMAMLDRLVEIRESLGMSQQDVGDIMGVSQPTVAQFESSGSNPKLSTIRRYALAIGALVQHSVHRQDDDWIEVPMRLRPENSNEMDSTRVITAAQLGGQQSFEISPWDKRVSA